MTVQDWINEGKDYNTGVQLYIRLGGNPNLIRLFLKRENKWNRNKLTYELKKFEDVEEPEPEDVPVKKPSVNESAKFLKSKPISYYPPELHEVYLNRIKTFLKACSLKVQLNALDENDTLKSLEFQNEIWELFEANDNCWKILNHYEHTKQVLPVKSKSDFSELSPQKRVKKLHQLYANRSKRAKTILKMKNKLKVLEEGVSRRRLEYRINKKLAELQQMDLDIDKLKELIDGQKGS